MTDSLIAQVTDFVNTNFPGSKLEGAYRVMSFKSKFVRHISNREIYQPIVDRLCVSPTWLVGVNVEPALTRPLGKVERRTVTDQVDWDCTEEYSQFFMELQGSINVASTQKLRAPCGLFLIEPRRKIIVDADVYGLEIFASDSNSIDELLKGIEPLQTPSVELDRYLAEAFPRVRHGVGAALMEFHADATRRLHRVAIQTVIDRFGKHKCWLVATALPDGLVPHRSETVTFLTDAEHRQIVAEVSGDIDAEELVRKHQPPQTLALVDPQSGIVFSLPDRTLYGTSHAALAGFTVGLEAALEPA